MACSRSEESDSKGLCIQGFNRDEQGGKYRFYQWTYDRLILAEKSCDQTVSKLCPHESIMGNECLLMSLIINELVSLKSNLTKMIQKYAQTMTHKCLLTHLRTMYYWWMKAIKKSKKILKTYLSRKLSQDEFEEAMKHPVLSTRQKLEITDAYFESIGSRDITDQLIGQASINIRRPMS